MPNQSELQNADDILTPLAATILRHAGPDAYGNLTITSPTPVAAHQLLEGVAAPQLFSRAIKNIDDANAALACLWIWHDALDPCHAIVQDIVSPTGSLLHAIVHRREGDFSNAKYWYRRCESHHVIRMMGAVASSMASELESDRLVAHAVGEGWNPLGFVDLVQAVHNKPSDPRFDLAVRLQRAEWEGIFNHCIRAAVDADSNQLDDWDKRVMNPSGG